MKGVGGLGGFAWLVVWKWMDDGRMGSMRVSRWEERENDETKNWEGDGLERELWEWEVAEVEERGGVSESVGKFRRGGDGRGVRMVGKGRRGRIGEGEIGKFCRGDAAREDDRGLKMNGRKCDGGKGEDGLRWGAKRGGEDGGATVRRRRQRRLEDDIVVMTVEKNLWRGQRVAVVVAAAAARMRAAAAAARMRAAVAVATAVGLHPRPSLSNHLRGRSLLSFFK